MNGIATLQQGGGGDRAGNFAGTVGCKRYYRLTAAGKAVYDGERARLQRCLDDAARAAITAPASLTKGAEHDENERETDRAPSGALPAL